MDLHNPQKLNLPALKYEKSKKRKEVENDKYVKNLISSKKLLGKDLNELLIKIFSISKDIDDLLEVRNDEKKLEYSLIDSGDYRTLRFLEWKLQRSSTKKNTEEIDKIKKDIKERKVKINKKLKSYLLRMSTKIVKELDEFETSNSLKLEILQTSTLFLCKNCKKILGFGRFHSKRCSCGEEVNSPSLTETITIYKFNPNMKEFIDKDIWLEHAIDYILRRKDFNTLCGVHILGHSGIPHEIDNLAELHSDNLRILCECKNKDVSVNEVFIFSGKMIDIGCSRGYIFTTSFETTKEVKHLARTKNIAIIEKVLEKNPEDLIKEIRE